MSVALLAAANPATARPKVSIAMPSCGRSDVIGHTLQSVVKQRFEDFEVLVRHDGPDPKTARVVASLGDRRFRYLESSAREGMPRNLNAILPFASGEYVLVLHDHDLFDLDLVGRMVEALDRHPTALYVHTALQQIDREGRVTRQFIGGYADLTNGRRWLEHMLSRFDCPVSAMSMVRRSAYETHGVYDTDYGFVSDVEMWMRLACHGDVAYINDVLMSCRLREAGHEYREVDWDLTDILVRIHRQYEREAGRLAVWPRLRFSLRAESFRLTQLLATLKRSRGAKAAREKAARYLRAEGGPVTRAVARVL